MKVLFAPLSRASCMCARFFVRAFPTPLFVQYSELVDTGRAKSLSVLELKLRVLLKGKVKVDQQQKKEKALPRQVASIFTAQSTCTLFRSRSTLFRTRSTARRTDQSGMSDGPSRSSPSPASMTDRSTEDEGRPSSRSSFTSESAEQDAVSNASSCIDLAHTPVKTSSHTRNTGRRRCPTAYSTSHHVHRTKHSRTLSSMRCCPGPLLQTRQFDKKRQKSQRGTADPLYASVIGLRSAPLSKFLQQTTLQWQLPMTSICESRLLMEIGVPNSERNQIMGLQRRASELGTLSGPGGLTEPQLVARAIGRLATDPPQLVGAMQRRTTSWLLRQQYKPLASQPSSLASARVSCLMQAVSRRAEVLRQQYESLALLACWGPEHLYVIRDRILPAKIAELHRRCVLPTESLRCPMAGLNMSNNDVALQLHFALFKGSRGYVLKPSAMCARTFEDHQVAEEEDSEMIFWPTAREMLHRTTVRLHSLHNFPKVAVTAKRTHPCAPCAQSVQVCASHNTLRTACTRQIQPVVPCAQRGERRLRLDGSRRDCHCYVPELSGANNCPPNNRDPAMPAISLTLHSIGGNRSFARPLSVSAS
jgi:hypothetical protein